MSDEDEGNKNRNEGDSGSKVRSTPSSDSVNVSVSDVGSDGLDDMLKGMDDDLKSDFSLFSLTLILAPQTGH